jgi:RNA polymerase sigma-70 factor (ECF subfamily)
MATNSESRFPLLRELTNHQNSIYAYIFSLVPNREAAQEILQETNLVICEKADQFLAGSHFLTWACAIARFKVLAYRRDTTRDKLIFGDDLSEKLASGDVQRFDLSTRMIALEKCLEKLPARQRAMIKDRYRPDVTMEVLADRLGRAKQSLAVTLHRIRQTLLECLQRTEREGELK